MAERVLIIDDDAVQRRLLENLAGKAGYETTSIDRGEAALKAMLATAGTSYDCVMLDLALRGMDGFSVLRRMREAGIEIPVIVQTTPEGFGDVVAAMQSGAFDLVVKPVGFERLSVSLRNAVATQMLVAEIARLKHTHRNTIGFNFHTGAPRIPTQMHASLAPNDDVIAQQTCKSARRGGTMEAPLFFGDDRSPERFSVPETPGSRFTLNLLNNEGHARSLEDVEADVIRFVLVRYSGQMSEVARRLRIGCSTLYRKLKVLDWAIPNNTTT